MILHKWISTEGNVQCITCGLLVDGAVLEDGTYPMDCRDASVCKGEGCEVYDEHGMEAPHYLISLGSGKAQCYYCQLDYTEVSVAHYLRG